MKFKIGDTVKNARFDNSDFCRPGDVGKVVSIDADGELWVIWNDPYDHDQGDLGWCIAPEDCDPA